MATTTTISKGATPASGHAYYLPGSSITPGYGITASNTTTIRYIQADDDISKALKSHNINTNYLRAFVAINKIVNNIVVAMSEMSVAILTVVNGSKTTELPNDMRAFGACGIDSSARVSLYKRVWDITVGDFKFAMKFYEETTFTDSTGAVGITSATKDLLRHKILEDIKLNPMEWTDDPDIGELARSYLNIGG